MSLMSAAMRRVMASFSACTSSTSSMAVIERREGRLALGLERFPVGQHFVPEQGGEQEAGRGALALAFTRASVLASESQTNARPSAVRE
jgi:hypothetical protein